MQGSDLRRTALETSGEGYKACLLRGKLEFKDVDLLVLTIDCLHKKTGMKASLKDIDGYFFGIEFARLDLGLVGNYITVNFPVEHLSPSTHWF
jgi:hypothetical protein